MYSIWYLSDIGFSTDININIDLHPVAADDTVAMSEIKFVPNTVFFECRRFCVLIPTACVEDMTVFTFYDLDILIFFKRIEADWTIIDVVEKHAFAALWLIL